MSRTADPTAKIVLLTAAQAVFEEHGLDAARVEDITRRAGMAKGTFYSHFASKEEAFKQVVESFLARLQAHVTPPAPDTVLPTEPAEFLRFWLERDTVTFEFLWLNRGLVGIVFACHGEHAYVLESFRERMIDTTQRWIDVWKQHGFLRRDIGTEAMSWLICGSYNELSLRVMRAGTRPPIEDYLQVAQGVFVRGVGTEELVAAYEASQIVTDVTSRRVVGRGAPRKARGGLQ